MNKRSHGKRVILVNGIPASGKSGLAQAVSQQLGFPYLQLDLLKEPFMALHHELTRQENRALGKAAYEVLWRTVASAPNNCTYVIDAWFGFQPKQNLMTYLKQAGVQQVFELWNQISPESVCERYRKRIGTRPAGHPGHEYLPELAQLAQQAEPMNLGETFIVNQDSPLDYGQIYRWLDQQLNTKQQVSAAVPVTAS